MFYGAQIFEAHDNVSLRKVLKYFLLCYSVKTYVVSPEKTFQ